MHLKKLNLESSFKNCFLELNIQQHEWVWNPFAVTTSEKIKSSFDKPMYLWWNFPMICLSRLSLKLCLWLSFLFVLKKQHLELSQLPTEVLLLFGKTCKKTFSAMAAIKSKYCKHLQRGNEQELLVIFTFCQFSWLAWVKITWFPWEAVGKNKDQVEWEINKIYINVHI
jgi:hypothetical protein